MRQLNISSKSGFTIIELSFSIAFIAILSIIILVVISNAVSAYHRGLTLNQLNTTGMDLVEEMRTTIQSSPARSAKQECSNVYSDSGAKNDCEQDNGLSFIYRERNATVRVGSSEFDSPVYGVFCTGAYSYIWNSGYFFNPSENEYEVKINSSQLEPVTLKYKRTGSDNVIDFPIDFKLLKIQDEKRQVCKIFAGANPDGLGGGTYYPNSDNSSAPKTIDLSSQSIDEDPVDLLAGNNNLALYDLTTALPAESEAANMLYPVSFILGTVQGGINISAGGNYCTTPEDYENASVENFDYCAINKFNFAAQATGG